MLLLPHIFVSKPNEGVKFYCKHRKSANTTSVLLHFGAFLAFFLQVFFLHDKHEGVICTTLTTSNHSSQSKPKANLTPTWKAFFKQISRAITFWNSRFFPPHKFCLKVPNKKGVCWFKSLNTHFWLFLFRLSQVDLPFSLTQKRSMPCAILIPLLNETTLMWASTCVFAWPKTVIKIDPI